MDYRLRKKVLEARRLRDLSPAESIEIGDGMSRFALELREAADRARA